MFERVKLRFFAGDSGNVLKGMLTLLIGAGLARAVGLLSMPILTRIYSPENLGVLAIFISIVAIIAPLLSLRYVQAIPLPKSDVLALALFRLCLKLIFILGMVISLLLMIWGEVILGWFNYSELAAWWWLIALGVLGTALYELFSMWATRKKHYRVLAKTQFSQAFVGNFVKIVLGLLSFKLGGLIFGQVVSQTAGVVSLYKESSGIANALNATKIKKKEKFVAHCFKGFVWFRLPSQFIMVASLQMPIMLAAFFYDKQITGQLSLAMMVISVPVKLIGDAMSKAYYAEIASLGKYNPGRIKNITIAAQKKLFLVGVPLAMCLYFFSGDALVYIFGERWQLAGDYAGLLAPYVLLQFTSVPLVQVLNVIGSQGIFLIINCLRFVGTMVVALLVSLYSMEAEAFVMSIGLYLATFMFGVSVYILYKVWSAAK